MRNCDKSNVEELTPRYRQIDQAYEEMQMNREWETVREASSKDKIHTFIKGVSDKVRELERERQ